MGGRNLKFNKFTVVDSVVSVRPNSEKGVVSCADCYDSPAISVKAFRVVNPSCLERSGKTESCQRNMTARITGIVIATAASHEHIFSKEVRWLINLVERLGVEGDCHTGRTVQHRSRLHIQPPPLNLRQVHLMPVETLSNLGLQPAELGENITISGIDLLVNLSKGSRVHFIDPDLDESEALVREHPILEIQGLRNSCPQIEKYRDELQEKFIIQDENRKIIKRSAGVMSTVEVGRIVSPKMIFICQPIDFEELGCV